MQISRPDDIYRSCSGGKPLRNRRLAVEGARWRPMIGLGARISWARRAHRRARISARECKDQNLGSALSGPGCNFR
jgi:hypothetical protein